MVKRQRREENNPLVFLDISIGGEDIGRIVIELFKDVVPKVFPSPDRYFEARVSRNGTIIVSGCIGLALHARPMPSIWYSNFVRFNPRFDCRPRKILEPYALVRLGWGRALESLCTSSMFRSTVSSRVSCVRQVSSFSSTRTRLACSLNKLVHIALMRALCTFLMAYVVLWGMYFFIVSCLSQFRFANQND